MPEQMNLSRGLDAFAEQFAAQIANAGPPSSEHAVHFCLALGLQAAYNLAPGAVVFEWPRGTKRIDLWVPPLDLAIEVKYRRPIPSGYNSPATQLFGQLLADFNKVAELDAANRLVLFVSDAPGMTYLRNSGLLPLSVDDSGLLTTRKVQSLPKTASAQAFSAGEWRDLEAKLLWMEQRAGWNLLAWVVNSAPISQTEDTQSGLAPTS